MQYTAQQVQASISQSIVTQGGSLENKLIDIGQAQQLIYERLQRVEESLVHGTKITEKSNYRPLDAPVRRADTSLLQGQSSGRLFAEDSFSALRMRFLQQTKCQQWCECHTYKRSHSPRGLEPIFGTLFYGYTGLPTATPQCSNNDCRRSSEAFLQVNYYFPAWFFAWAMSLAMKIQGSRTPQFSLRILNLRDSYEEISKAPLAVTHDQFSIF